MNKQPDYDPRLAGQRVREARKRARLSQEELAGLSNVSAGYIGEFEKGERPNARQVTLDAIARGLDAPSWDAFMDDEEPAAPHASPPGLTERERLVARKLAGILESLLGDDKAKPEAVAAASLVLV